MRGKTVFLLLLWVTAALLRFWRLGATPPGLSAQEAKLGLWAAGFLGEGILDPFWVRLPFAAVGTIEILLLFAVTKRLTNDFFFAFLSSLLLVFLPWHIQLSRVYSSGLLVFGALLLLAIVFDQRIKKHSRKLGVLSLGLTLAILALSILWIPNQGIGAQVDWQRNLATRVGVKLPQQLLANKFIESYRFREKLIFENLDIGNYLFTGHPRERWGVEEIQKLYISLIPLIILGLFLIERKLFWLLAPWFSLTLVLAALLGFRTPGATLPFLFPIVFLATRAVTFLFKSRRGRVFLYVLGGVFLLEFSIFSRHYFLGLLESPFSPRRPIFSQLVPKVLSLMGPDEPVLVSQRVGDPAPFFSFFAKSESLANFEFRTFNIWQEEQKDKLFVDVLPDEASPAEPLFRKNGNWPEVFAVLAQFYDQGRRQTVVLYRYQ